jgi:signal transduction histidine kinase
MKQQLNETPGRPMQELAASNRQLQRGVTQRKLAKEDLQKRGKHHHKCLAQSLQLQKLLRQLAHQALAAQEDARKKLSHELQDEIAQILLGINVRLLSLKQTARHNTTDLRQEIADVQQLVISSAQSLRRFARELDTPGHSLSVPSGTGI